MNIRPIILSDNMIRALLAGRKTQTRSLLKGAWPAALEGHDVVKTWFAPFDIPREGVINQWAKTGVWAVKHGPRGYNRFVGYAPHRPGDRLWVREAHHVWSPGNINGTGQCVAYRATDPDAPTTWTPSTFMPRWASRITLHVNSLGIERLHDISEEDAIAEGVEEVTGQQGFQDDDRRLWRWYRNDGICSAVPNTRASYASLWNTLHGLGSWEKNPHVCVVGFTVDHTGTSRDAS